MDGRGKKQPRGLKNFLIVCSSIIVTLIFVEMVFSQFSNFGKNGKKTWIKTERVWGSCYTSNPERYFPIKTVDPLTNEPMYCVFYDYDQRKAGYFTERQEQVAIVGDSFAFGEGLKEEDTLGYLLGKRFGNFNFQNFSVPGTDIAYIYRKVYAIIQGVKDIKVIVYFYNLNDLLTAEPLQKEQNTIFDMQNIRWEEMKNGCDPLAHLLSGSTIFRLIKKALVFREASRLTIQNYDDMYFSPRNHDGCRESTALLSAMNTLAQSRGIKFYVVIYPLFYKDIFGRYPFQNIHDFLMDACVRNQIVCYDAYEPFRDYYSFKKFILHPVDYHPNGMANRLILEFLSRQGNFLQDNSDIKKPKTF